MARPRDVIDLNVGGKIIPVKRSTFREVEGSKLAAMVSEETEDRDKNNYIFLDINPDHFAIIVNCLRAKNISDDTNVPFPKLNPEEVRPFLELAQQLGLEEQFSFDIPKFKLHGPWIGIENKASGSIAKHIKPNRPVGYALSDVHPRGFIRWSLKIESIKTQMFIGVLNADTEPYDNRSYDMQGSYGWLLMVGESAIGSAFNDGKKIYNLIADIKQGDTVEVLLNSVSTRLSLVVSPVREYHMFLPNENGWRLHINLFNKDDEIQIVLP